jgi:hypothetical protein
MNLVSMTPALLSGLEGLGFLLGHSFTDSCASHPEDEADHQREAYKAHRADDDDGCVHD